MYRYVCVAVFLHGMYRFLYVTKQRLQISSSETVMLVPNVNRIPHADTEERIRCNTHSVGSLVHSFEVIPG